jgi:hypothetical protein
MYPRRNFEEKLIGQAEANIRVISAIFFTLVFLCATQDIAVDGLPSS